MSTPSQPLVFEGPDPKRLLLEVFAAHGPGAKISEPVAVREGGVLGFFAKMHYRVEVTPPAPGGSPATPAPTPAPRSVAAAVAAADATAAPGATSATGAALAGLIAQTEDEVDLNTSRQESFEEILDKVASSLGEEPGAELALLGAPAIAATPSMPTVAPVTRPGRVLRNDELANAVFSELPLAPLAPGDALVAPRRPPMSPATSAPAAPVHHKTMEEELAGLALEPARRGELGGVVMPAGVSTDLALVGFPLRLLGSRAGELSSLSEAFGLAPVARALPKTAGSLIAVVGSGGRALSAAKAIAAEIGMEHAAIPRALARRGRSAAEDHLVVHDATEAADLSPGWRRGRAVVVTVSVPATADAGEWTRAVLGGLAPSMTLLVASAAAKTEDVQAMVQTIGGVDGLVLEDCGETLTPASVLSAGLPIARLDGQPAGASAWVAVAERALERRSRGW
ncbi:MAG: hypothetical protein M0004_02655 [Actinomycetota bacterium]|nr:hypothetical protein [Actinomycetota bacterium]